MPMSCVKRLDSFCVFTVSVVALFGDDHEGGFVAGVTTASRSQQ